MVRTRLNVGFGTTPTAPRGIIARLKHAVVGPRHHAWMYDERSLSGLPLAALDCRQREDDMATSCQCMRIGRHPRLGGGHDAAARVGVSVSLVPVSRALVSDSWLM